MLTHNYRLLGKILRNHRYRYFLSILFLVSVMAILVKLTISSLHISKVQVDKEWQVQATKKVLNELERTPFKSTIQKIAFINNFVNTRFEYDDETKLIIKYFVLLSCDVSENQLKVFYTVNRTMNSPHIVLGLFLKRHNQPVILDNLSNETYIAGEKRDLMPVFSFSADRYIKNHLKYS